MTPLENFAHHATTFADWALHGKDTGASAARNALLHVTRLYLAGLQLPGDRGPEKGFDDKAFDVGSDERSAVSVAARRIPLDTYAEIFDPLLFPPEEPVIAMLADDLADIYRDVVRGLRQYNAGHHDHALWHWTFHLQSHWGEHATGAIRALHCWLADNYALLHP